MIDLNHFDGHTPGPWRVNPNQPEYVWSNDSQTICQAFGWASNVSHPNAKLIAAAPDLLAECKRQAEVIRELGALLGEARDDVSEVLSDYMLKYGTNYKQQRIEFQQLLLERIDNVLAKLEGEKS